MSAYNLVRFRVKPDQEEKFVEFYRQSKPEYNGMRKFTLIKTGEYTYAIIGEWDEMQSLINARPQMAERLDTMRDMLEDLGGDLGVTDPVSGPAMIEHINN